MMTQLSIAATAGKPEALMMALTLLVAPLPQVRGDDSSPAVRAAVRGEVDLLQRYPTKLTAGDANFDRGRSWEFTTGDIFQVAKFRLEVARQLRVEAGVADLGIGHCADGAVWAVLIPRVSATLFSPATDREEALSHVWLRFHPREINRLFPPETVSRDGATNLLARMRLIADSKITSSWQSAGKAIIPEPKQMTVDVDTENGPRRFFAVDTEKQTAQYEAAFEHESVTRAAVLTSKLTRKLAETAFDQLWEAFDRKYAMFVLRPEVDWASLREQYRPRALASKSTFEFAAVCAEMLKPLRDLHVWLSVGGRDVPVFNRLRSANSNPSAHARILGGLTNPGRLVRSTVTTNRIGFLGIYGWSDLRIPGRCDEILETMRDTRGLIVDVRLNGGGSEDLAAEVAGRFIDQPFVYAYDQRRNGPKHADLSGKTRRVVEPRGPWRYDRPVILLIGQKCMSSTESFVAMMSGDTNLTSMGDHTCGSSGNPEIIPLPLGMTVSVPQWIDYLPDGSLLDERGFRPRIPFAAKPGAFEGGRDDLLTAALERLRREPLPDKPIAWDASLPSVVSVFPPDGATAIEPVTHLRVQFDRQMDPSAVRLDWESGGFLDCGFPDYNAETHEFTIPVQLAPGVHGVVVNSPSPGVVPFRSPEGKAASRFLWQFEVTEHPQSEIPAKPAATPEKSEMLQTLEWMRQRRESMTSVEERVQSLSLSRRGGSYVQMRMEGKSFKWQKPDRYLADARTGVATRQNYAISCDGENWRWFAQNVGRTNFIVCPVKEVTHPDISFCDPFDLMTKTPEQTATDLGLRYCGAAKVGDSRRLVFEGVKIGRYEGLGSITNATRWLIDGDTGRLAEIRSSVSGALRGSQAEWRIRYLYDSINRPLSKEAFIIPCPASVTPRRPQGTNHLASVRDGGDSRMAVSFDNRGMR